MSDLTEHEKETNVLHELLKQAHYVFYVWKALQNEKYNSIYATNHFFWRATLDSLQNEWLMLLAKVYENSSHSKSGKVLSVYYLLDKQKDSIRAQKAKVILDEHKETIENICILRSNRLAHTNQTHDGLTKTSKRLPN